VGFDGNGVGPSDFVIGELRAVELASGPTQPWK